MSKNRQFKAETKPVFKPVLGSNTLVFETGEVKYLSVIVWDEEKDYTEFIVK